MLASPGDRKTKASTNNLQEENKMKKGIIGKKIGMTQIFDEVGNVIPVTVIQAGPCVIAQKKTVESDGYNAVQLGFGDVKEKHLKRDISPKQALSSESISRSSALTISPL